MWKYSRYDAFWYLGDGIMIPLLVLSSTPDIASFRLLREKHLNQEIDLYLTFQQQL